MDKKREKKYGVVVLCNGKESSIHLYSSLKKAESHYKNAKSEILGLDAVFIDKVIDNSIDDVRCKYRDVYVAKARELGLDAEIIAKIFNLAPNTIYKSCKQNSKISPRVTFKSDKMIPMETKTQGKGVFITPIIRRSEA